MSEESVDVIAEPATRRVRWLGRASRRGAVTVGALVLLTGCAAGQVAQTAREVPVVDGIGADVGTMTLRGVTVAAPQPSSWPKGGDAPLQLLMANVGQVDDQLTTVSSDAAESALITSNPSAGASSSGAASVASSPASASGAVGASVSPVNVPATHSVSVGFPGAPIAIVLQRLKTDLFPAQTISVTFTFARAGSVTFPISVHLTDPPSNRPTVNVAPTAE